jgi:tetratricopeptide (TPR) repeat protein
MKAFAAIAASSALLLGGAMHAAEPASAPQGTLKRGDAYFHLMRAGIAASAGRGSEVVAALKDAAALEPDSAALQAEGASLLQMLGRKTDAERMARRALEIDPKQRGATRVLADLAASRALSNPAEASNRQEAIRLYEQLAADPDADADLFPILVRLRLQGGDKGGAVDAARRYAQKRPGDEGATRLLAQTMLHDGNTSDALDTLLAHLQRNPDSEDLLTFAAELTRQTKQWERLDPVLVRFLDAHPGSALARGLHGECLLRSSQPVAAAAELEKALELAPGEPMIRLHLATAYGTLGRFADAVAIAQGLAAQFPDNGGIRAVLGEALARQGDVNAALDAFEEALRGLGPQDDGDEGAAQRDDIRRSMARLHIERKRYDEAGRVLGGLEDAADPESLELRGRLAILSRDFGAAREVARRLRAAKEPAAAAMLEGDALVREGSLEQGMEKLREGIAILGPEGRLTAAASLLDAGHAKEGEKLLAEWVEAEPKNAEARFRLGSYLEREGRLDAAEIELKESIRLDPEHDEVLNFLGYSYADRNVHLDEALSLIQRALAIDPWNGAYLDSLGWTYYRLGRFPEAKDPLERAARDLPWDPTVLEHLGDVYDRLGESERAIATWQRALDSGAEGADALRTKIGRGRSALRPPAGAPTVRAQSEAPASPPD